MKKIVFLMLLTTIFVTGCGKTHKTYDRAISACETAEKVCNNAQEIWQKQLDDEFDNSITLLSEENAPKTCKEYCESHPVFIEKTEHYIDKDLGRCVAKNSTTAGMRKCSVIAMGAWKKEIKTKMLILKKKLPPEKYAKLEKSQKKWEEFFALENEVNNAIIFEKNGSYYQVAAYADKIALLKDRASTLDSYIHYVTEEF